MSRTTTTRRLALGVAALAVLASGAAVAPAAEAAPYCGITWGSLARTAGDLQAQTVTHVRTGRHACFDRLVIDLAGRTPAGYDVRYVTQVTQDGSGDPVPLRGGARLSIVVKAPAYDQTGNATYRFTNAAELANVSGYSTFRQVAWAGSFEGVTTIGLGVRARLPHRVFVLDDGTTSRLVIDVANRW